MVARQRDASDQWVFSFSFSPSLVELMPRGRLVSAVIERSGQLPFAEGAGEPFGSSTDEGAKLKELLSEGYVVDKWGSLKLPFSANPSRKAVYAKGMKTAEAYFRDRSDFVTVVRTWLSTALS